MHDEDQTAVDEIVVALVEVCRDSSYAAAKYAARGR